MKHATHIPPKFDSISALHRALGLPKPLHPLISLINYGDINTDVSGLSRGMILNFYKVSYKVIEKAKDYLSTSSLYLAEIAYQLYFGHPQSFNRIFKKKTSMTPISFKESFYKN